MIIIVLETPALSPFPGVNMVDATASGAPAVFVFPCKGTKSIAFKAACFVAYWFSMNLGLGLSLK